MRIYGGQGRFGHPGFLPKDRLYLRWQQSATTMSSVAVDALEVAHASKSRQDRRGSGPVRDHDRRARRRRFARLGRCVSGPGATFYTGWFTTEVGYFPTATGVCTPLPQGADSLIATTPVTNVSIYRAADCSGSETAVGTLRNWEPNVFKSFIAR
ncbi:hypothetical protein GCM10027614_63690 [Micromonospora vulcania]